MAYLGSWKIDDNLTFCCNTHDPDTGVATDADSVPTYRVYEDETGTAILTGSMALLDSSNTTGFYSEQITLSAANGFEKGKCYTVYISATVDSDTGTMHHTFQMEAEVDVNTVSDLHTDLDDGGRLDLLIDAIKAKTDNLPADPADDSDIDSQLATIDGVVDAIKAVTDNLPDSGALNDLAAILADTGTDGVAIATATAQAVADEILKRAVSNVEDTADAISLAALVLAAFKSGPISGTSWPIYKTDGVTTFATRTVTKDTDADPITGVT